MKLSGETPKIEGKIKTLAINLGPDFMTDIVKIKILLFYLLNFFFFLQNFIGYRWN